MPGMQAPTGNVTAGKAHVGVPKWHACTNASQVITSGYTYGFAQVADVALASIESLCALLVAPSWAALALNLLHMAAIILAMRRWVLGRPKSHVSLLLFS